MRDTVLYERLGVSPNATSEEISKAYKKLAIKLHPDKNKDDPNSDTKFREINEAKEVLTDDGKRKMYNQHGMNYVNNNCQDQTNINPEDIFGQMFGGMHGMPGMHGMSGMQGMHRQREDIVMNVDVNLDDIYNEKTINIKYEQKHICEICKGVTSKCNTCNGNGVQIQIIQMGPMIQQIQRPCLECNGTGQNKNANNCNFCTEGYKYKEVNAKIPLKNGLSSGQKIQIKNQGHHLKNEKTDLIIIINEKPHPVFKRNNNDLIIDIELKLFQAIYGFEKIIKHLDNRELHLSYNGKTEYNSIKKIPNEGMQILNSSDKGNLYINFKFNLPSLDNIDMSSKLLYLLKILDQNEANIETTIKNTDKKYNKTILLNVDKYEESSNNQQQQQHQQQCQTM